MTFPTHTLAAPDTLSPARRSLLAALVAAALLGLIPQVVVPLLTGGPSDSTLVALPYTITMILAAGIAGLRALWIEQDRLPWLAFALAVTANASATVIYDVWVKSLDPMPFPNAADAFFLASYVFFYAGVGLLVRSQLRGTRVAFWFDGAIVALGLALLASLFLFGDLLTPMGGSPLAVATNLAYPVADVAVVGMIGGIFSVTAWRPGQVWGLLAAGFAVLAAVDAYYLIGLSDGTYRAGGLMDVLWPLAMLLIAAAAWSRPGPGLEYRSRGWAEILTPAVVSLVSVAVLVIDHLHHLPMAAMGLAALALLAVGVRATITVLEVSSLAHSRREALTDDLTGLPNRRAFMRALDAAVASEREHALLLMDLDDFKELNDTLGHATGDALLRRIGQRIHAHVRDGDLFARLGGDEFALLAPAANRAEAEVLAKRLKRDLQGSIALPEVTVHVDGSIGIAITTEHGADAPALLRCADVAMYHAKHARRPWAVYEPEHDPHSAERLRVQAELRTALDGGQLCLVYQPKATLADGRITGVEALVRWQHPVRGMLTPDKFLPIAERCGLMRELTLEVLDLAFAQGASWSAQGRPLAVSVNLSPSSLRDDRLVFDVDDALARQGLPARMVTLEITESAMMEDVPQAIRVLSELKRLGVSVALDDFGTGHASLAHIKHLPIDELKIDRSFVMEMTTDRRDAAIVRLTVELARSLGLLVVAEGIEEAAAWDELLMLGCDQAQGYYLSRPLEVPALEQFVCDRAGEACSAG